MQYPHQNYVGGNTPSSKNILFTPKINIQDISISLKNDGGVQFPTHLWMNNPHICGRFYTYLCTALITGKLNITSIIYHLKGFKMHMRILYIIPLLPPLFLLLPAWTNIDSISSDKQSIFEQKRLKKFGHMRNGYTYLFTLKYQCACYFIVTQ